jgi:hypothetical protein
VDATVRVYHHSNQIFLKFHFCETGCFLWERHLAAIKRRKGLMNSHKIALFTVIYLIALIAWAAPAQAMRCGSRLISEGDPREKLVNECGQPSDVEAWEEERYDYFDRPPPARHYNEFERYGNAYRVRAFIRVEVWTYNYGPSRFIDYVRLENGIVRKIYSGGYGY